MSTHSPTEPTHGSLLKVAARFVPIPHLKQAVGNLDRNSDVDGSRAEQVFDFRYIPARDSLLAKQPNSPPRLKN